MTKVGILSTQRHANWGSALQCYALEKKLNAMGFDAEIIDYFPEDVTVKGQLKRLKNKSRLMKNPILHLGAICAFSISYVNKKRVFDKFIKKNLKLSSKTYYDAKEISADDPHEDIYCCGGDQTLNGFKVLDVFDRLPDDVVKVAYSSSFGKTDFEPDEYEHSKKSLSRFNALSCREDYGTKIMQEMGNNDAKWIIDPAFLLTAKQWQKLVSRKYKGKKYIVAYNLHHDKKIETLEKKLSQKYNLPVLNICVQWFEFYRHGKFLWCPSVEDFLSLIMNAEYVLSDSFHATVFSVLFHKKFMTVVPDWVGTRIESISNLLGIEDRIINWSEKKDYLSMIDKEIDYTRIDEIIKKERIKAEEYINSWKDLV